MLGAIGAGRAPLKLLDRGRHQWSCGARHHGAEVVGTIGAVGAVVGAIGAVVGALRGPW
jgi:hypothetical protein